MEIWQRGNMYAAIETAKFPLVSPTWQSSSCLDKKFSAL
jgi:hypothetical protein